MHAAHFHDDDDVIVDRGLNIERVGDEDFVQLDHAWLIPETVIAYANLAVQAAREPVPCY